MNVKHKFHYFLWLTPEVPSISKSDEWIEVFLKSTSYVEWPTVFHLEVMY